MVGDDGQIYLSGAAKDDVLHPVGRGKNALCRPYGEEGYGAEAGDYDSQRDLYPSGVIKEKPEMKNYSALCWRGRALFSITRWRRTPQFKRDGDRYLLRPVRCFLPAAIISRDEW